MFFRKKNDIEELNETTPLEVVEVFCTSVARRNIMPIPDKHSRIRTIVYTDGEIFKESKVETSNIKSYYFGTKEYEGRVDLLEKKKIYIRNHSYVVVYKTAEERKIKGNVCGLFDVIKEVKIYLKDINDKNALRRARYVIDSNKSFSRGIDYSSPLTMELSKATRECSIPAIPINPFEKKRELNLERPRPR